MYLQVIITESLLFAQVLCRLEQTAITVNLLCAHIHTHTYVRTDTHTCIQTHTHTCTQTRTHMHIVTHTYTHVHVCCTMLVFFRRNLPTSMKEFHEQMRRWLLTDIEIVFVPGSIKWPFSSTTAQNYTILRIACYTLLLGRMLSYQRRIFFNLCNFQYEQASWLPFLGSNGWDVHSGLSCSD